MDLSRCPAIQAAADCLAEKLLDPTVIEYEFERLWAASSGPEASNEISRSQDNAAKNRYVNVLPFDRNRICLAGTATGDYINASLITGDPAESESLALSQSMGSPRKISSASSQASSPSSSSHQVGSSSQQSSALGLSTPTQRPNSPPTSPPKTSPSRAYIATQGPLPTTTADFWQMVQEQGTAVIVMLTRHIEDASVPKCASYYPAKVGDSQTFGNFTVAVQAAEDYGTDIRRRRLLLTDMRTGRQREVQHFHYHRWPDHGIPSSTIPIRRLAHILEQGIASAAAPPGPSAIHCSAGIGRTGTFLVVDMMLRRLRGLDPKDVNGGRQAVNIKRIVAALRKERAGMVQSLAQYLFCYRAIKEELDDVIAGKSNRIAVVPLANGDASHLNP
ncbi:hypothetical protein WJX84_005936 [Apatococcus fuscideae]|uniref:Uncharacterized protein n=1 Tax=Apatococcus fuscideae TaxID=2026836 RepID=A0AAW1RR68_9CHLO